MRSFGKKIALSVVVSMVLGGNLYASSFVSIIDVQKQVKAVESAMEQNSNEPLVLEQLKFLAAKLEDTGSVLGKYDAINQQLEKNAKNIAKIEKLYNKAISNPKYAGELKQYSDQLNQAASYKRKLEANNKLLTNNLNKIKKVGGFLTKGLSAYELGNKIGKFTADLESSNATVLDGINLALDTSKATLGLIPVAGKLFDVADSVVYGIDKSVDFVGENKRDEALSDSDDMQNQITYLNNRVRTQASKYAKEGVSEDKLIENYKENVQSTIDYIKNNYKDKSQGGIVDTLLTDNATKKEYIRTLNILEKMLDPKSARLETIKEQYNDYKDVYSAISEEKQNSELILKNAEQLSLNINTNIVKKELNNDKEKDNAKTLVKLKETDQELKSKIKSVNEKSQDLASAKEKLSEATQKINESRKTSKKETLIVEAKSIMDKYNITSSSTKKERATALQKMNDRDREQFKVISDNLGTNSMNLIVNTDNIESHIQQLSSNSYDFAKTEWSSLANEISQIKNEINFLSGNIETLQKEKMTLMTSVDDTASDYNNDQKNVLKLTSLKKSEDLPKPSIVPNDRPSETTPTQDVEIPTVTPPPPPPTTTESLDIEKRFAASSKSQKGYATEIIFGKHSSDYMFDDRRNQPFTDPKVFGSFNIVKDETTGVVESVGISSSSSLLSSSNWDTTDAKHNIDTSSKALYVTNGGEKPAVYEGSSDNDFVGMLNHSSWGTWSDDYRFINGDVLVKVDHSYWVAGRSTVDLPIKGSAIYNAIIRGSEISNNIYIGPLSGIMNMEVDFADKSISGRLNVVRQDDSVFAIADMSNIVINTVSNSFTGKLTVEHFLNENHLDNKINGRFYGPTAQEIGGDWSIYDNELHGSKGGYGIFAGKASNALIDTSHIDEKMIIQQFEKRNGGDESGYSSFNSYEVAQDGSKIIFIQNIDKEMRILRDRGTREIESVGSQPKLGTYDSHERSKWDDSHAKHNLDTSSAPLYVTDGKEKPIIYEEKRDDAMGLKYTSWGTWSEGNTKVYGSNDEHKVDNSHWVAGGTTLDLPATGSATYNGVVRGSEVANGAYVGPTTGTMNMTVNFADKSISGSLNIVDRNNAAFATANMNNMVIDTSNNNAFSGTLSGNNIAQSTSNKINGRFYGPAAQEVGGAWDVRKTDGRNANGIFVGKR